MQLITISCVDPTIGLSERAKYFVIATGSMDLVTKNIYLRHVLRGRFEAPDQPRVITRAYLDWRPLYVGIEETFWQTSLIQYLRRQGVVPTRRIDRRKQHNADTGTRAMALAVRYHDGQILHPARVDRHGRDTGVASWLDPFEQELLAFTGVKGRDEYSDQVSAWTDVVKELTDLAADRMQLGVKPTYRPFVWDPNEEDEREYGAGLERLRKVAVA